MEAPSPSDLSRRHPDRHLETPFRQTSVGALPIDPWMRAPDSSLERYPDRPLEAPSRQKARTKHRQTEQTKSRALLSLPRQSLPPVQNKTADQTTKIEARRATSQTCCSGDRTGFCSPFSHRELKQGVSKLRTRRSPGVDAVTNDMPHQLRPTAEREMLELMNRSWRELEVPTA